MRSKRCFNCKEEIHFRPDGTEIGGEHREPCTEKETMYDNFEGDLTRAYLGKMTYKELRRARESYKQFVEIREHIARAEERAKHQDQ